MLVRTGRGRALVAAGTAVLLVVLSASALVVTRDDVQSAPGLAQEFARIDTTYQGATRSFVDQAQELDSADLRTALRLYTLVLDAAKAARRDLGELGSVEATERPTERMARALEVQELALQDAITASRNRDESGTASASQQFQTGVLAYLAAREDMSQALRSCGSRCR